MTLAYVSVGSNVRPLENVPMGLARLAEEERVVAASTFYRTPPVGPAGQPPFVNGVVALETVTSPHDLKWRVLRGVEAALGRIRTEDKYAPRPLDLDLLLYGDAVTTAEDLQIPDPEVTERPFLALPLQELAPDLVLPGGGPPIREVARKLDGARMEPLPALTAQVRRALGL